MYGDIDTADIESYTNEHVNIVGKIGKANINVVSSESGIIGKGTFNSGLLDVDDLKINIASQNSRCHTIGQVNNTLDVTLIGAAKLRYYGTPQIINQDIDVTAKLINE